ncbi:hypothetical protein [Runella aurantiaca]|uniref:STAS/SEC14 domain-containing protein n=1 Tax=Runella aurantiaca TaxID=2282308 RepID=A0A369HZL0_9BACT|nr:hypothetical protein [Runella aurantiaca]RDB02961.1 hypothetical protein DVG78_26195 [Runella aurantiaca]
MNSSVTTLFHEAERLDNRSLDAFIDDILSLRIRRETPDKQKEEAMLLKKINRSLPIEQIQRFRVLNQKRLEDDISEPEYAELLILLHKIEKLNVSRLKYLTSLARLRKVSVRELMNQLGISNSLNG